MEEDELYGGNNASVEGVGENGRPLRYYVVATARSPKFEENYQRFDRFGWLQDIPLSKNAVIELLSFRLGLDLPTLLQERNQDAIQDFDEHILDVPANERSERVLKFFSSKWAQEVFDTYSNTGNLNGFELSNEKVTGHGDFRWDVRLQKVYEQNEANAYAFTRVKAIGRLNVLYNWILSLPVDLLERIMPSFIDKVGRDKSQWPSITSVFRENVDDPFNSGNFHFPQEEEDEIIEEEENGNEQFSEESERPNSHNQIVPVENIERTPEEQIVEEPPHSLFATPIRSNMNQEVPGSPDQLSFHRDMMNRPIETFQYINGDYIQNPIQSTTCNLNPDQLNELNRIATILRGNCEFFKTENTSLLPEPICDNSIDNAKDGLKKYFEEKGLKVEKVLTNKEFNDYGKISANSNDIWVLKGNKITQHFVAVRKWEDTSLAKIVDIRNNETNTIQSTNNLIIEAYAGKNYRYCYLLLLYLLINEYNDVDGLVSIIKHESICPNILDMAQKHSYFGFERMFDFIDILEISRLSDISSAYNKCKVSNSLVYAPDYVNVFDNSKHSKFSFIPKPLSHFHLEESIEDAVKIVSYFLDDSYISNNQDAKQVWSKLSNPDNDYEEFRKHFKGFYMFRKIFTEKQYIGTLSYLKQLLNSSSPLLLGGGETVYNNEYKLKFDTKNNKSLESFENDDFVKDPWNGEIIDEDEV